MRVNLSGKVAIVTGGSKGIGRAMSLALAENGARLAVVARGAKDAEAVAQEVRSKGGEAVFERADIDIYQDIEAMVGRVLQRWGRVDIMIASGGPMYTPKLLLEMDPKAIPGFFARTFSRIYCAKAVVGPMVKQKFGKIIFLGTDGGRWPTPSESVNGAAGAAVVFFTRCLAMELARHGIRVYTISTTLTKDTPGYEVYLKMQEQAKDETIGKAFRKIEERVPFGLNRPEDVAHLALFLASDESNQISGATISINGGICFP